MHAQKDLMNGYQWGLNYTSKADSGSYKILELKDLIASVSALVTASVKF